MYYAVIIEGDKVKLTKIVNHMVSIGWTKPSDLATELALKGALTLDPQSRAMYYDPKICYSKSNYIGTLITFEEFCEKFDYVDRPGQFMVSVKNNKFARVAVFSLLNINGFEDCTIANRDNIVYIFIDITRKKMSCILENPGYHRVHTLDYLFGLFKSQNVKVELSKCTAVIRDGEVYLSAGYSSQLTVEDVKKLYGAIS